jgi:iron complex transport system permease protein
MKWSAAISATHRISPRSVTVGLLALVAVIAVVASLFIGAMHLPIGEVVAALTGRATEGRDAQVILMLRLPRILLAVIVGSALSVSGAGLQGLFRNPLADPTLIGISSGAALGAVATILFESQVQAAIPFLAHMPLVPLAGFVCGFAAMALTEGIASRRFGDSTAALILAGIAVTAMCSAGMGLLIYLSNDNQLRDIIFWTMGSLATGGWPAVFLCAPFVIVGVGLVLSIGQPLDALLLGEREAGHLGVNVTRLRRRTMVGAALAVGAAVGVSGIIGFVGLVVPHLIRLTVGPGHRTLLPASALLGITLTLIADGAARTIIAPAELPIGLVTNAVGGPFFLWLLLRHQAGRS